MKYIWTLPPLLLPYRPVGRSFTWDHMDIPSHTYICEDQPKRPHNCYIELIFAHTNRCVAPSPDADACLSENLKSRRECFSVNKDRQRQQDGQNALYEKKKQNWRLESVLWAEVEARVRVMQGSREDKKAALKNSSVCSGLHYLKKSWKRQSIYRGTELLCVHMSSHMKCKLNILAVMEISFSQAICFILKYFVCMYFSLIRK